jgi:DNA-binding transcriptional regulator YdaS (Cro superfamily)
MHNFATARQMVAAHRQDAIGKVIIQILERRLLPDLQSEVDWTKVLGAVLEIQTLRLKQDLH